MSLTIHLNKQLDRTSFVVYLFLSVSAIWGMLYYIIFYTKTNELHYSNQSLLIPDYKLLLFMFTIMSFLIIWIAKLRIENIFKSKVEYKKLIIFLAVIYGLIFSIVGSSYFYKISLNKYNTIRLANCVSSNFAIEGNPFRDDVRIVERIKPCAKEKMINNDYEIIIKFFTFILLVFSAGLALLKENSIELKFPEAANRKL